MKSELPGCLCQACVERFVISLWRVVVSVVCERERRVLLGMLQQTTRTERERERERAGGNQ